MKTQEEEEVRTTSVCSVFGVVLCGVVWCGVLLSHVTSCQITRFGRRFTGALKKRTS
jgi:hypothetical protein